MTIVRFVIKKVVRELYWTGKEGASEAFTMYLDKAKTFSIYGEAETAINNLPEDFYQIDKIFKVKK